jgi:hypothetical protein
MFRVFNPALEGTRFDEELLEKFKRVTHELDDKDKEEYKDVVEECQTTD